MSILKDIKIGGQQVIASYIGNVLVWAKQSTLTLDFVNQTYEQNSQLVALNEVINFTRASKAWLVVNNALQEYAADTPRITSKGLFVEQESTNYVNYSFLPQEDNYTDGRVAFIDGFWRKTGSNTGYLYPRSTAVNEQVIASIYSIGETAFDSMVANNVINDMTANVPLSTLVLPSISSSNAGIYWSSGSTSNAPVPLYWQIEKGAVASSPIETTTEPVTRAADVLTLKEPVTGITGDWDNTLNLSIVNGQLTTSGYGNIRTLNIVVN